LDLKIDLTTLFDKIKQTTMEPQSEPKSSSISSETHYIPPKTVPLPEDYGSFYNSLTENEKQLIELAKEKLGSSFIIRWTHMYKKWEAKTKSK